MITPLRAFANNVLTSAQHVQLNRVIATDAAQCAAAIVTTTTPASQGDPIAILRFLWVVNSINYCYWAGTSTYKPAGQGANKLYQIVHTALLDYGFGPQALKEIARDCMQARFPLSAERAYHLHELEKALPEFPRLIEAATATNRDPNRQALLALETLVDITPSFGGDIFLKRAVLLLHEFSKTTGLLLGVQQFPAPVDYHTPNVLRNLGVLTYSAALAQKIDQNQILPKHSQEEIEIRSATLVACDLMAKEVDCSPYAIDQFLFAQRKRVPHPHHLTVTTDY